jgi:hypothetical protein
VRILFEDGMMAEIIAAELEMSKSVVCELVAIIEENKRKSNEKHDKPT